MPLCARLRLARAATGRVRCAGALRFANAAAQRGEADSPLATAIVQVALVTGANSGIGYECAKELATHGARVILAGRSREKVDAAVKKLKACRPTCSAEGVVVDLASFASIEAVAKELRDKVKLKALHVLVNCAGIFLPPHAKTEQGLEMQLGVNHVGTAYLTALLLPLLKAAKGARVVVVASSLASAPSTLDWEDVGGEKLTESSFSTYAASKLCNALYTLELNTRCKDSGVEAFCVNPGRMIATNITAKADQASWIMKVLPVAMTVMAVDAADGALPVLHAATTPGLAGGSFFSASELNSRVVQDWTPFSAAFTPENGKRLMDETLKLIIAKGGKPDAK